MFEIGQGNNNSILLFQEHGRRWQDVPIFWPWCTFIKVLRTIFRSVLEK